MPKWTRKDRRNALKLVRSMLSDEKPPRNALVKFTAARFILGEADPKDPPMSQVTDAGLLAEVYRRGLQAPTVDLDAAERAMEERSGEG